MYANELLKQIRQHSSPSGDALQRLAHYFANGLEARLVGEGMFSFLKSKRSTAAEFLKAHQDFLSVSPFKKLRKLTDCAKTPLFGFRHITEFHRSRKPASF